MNRTQIYLPKTQLDALRKTARKRDTTVSEIIRILIKKGLEGRRREQAAGKQAETLQDVLEEVKGYKEEGPKNLARDIDKYLYGRK